MMSTRRGILPLTPLGVPPTPPILPSVCALFARMYDYYLPERGGVGENPPFYREYLSYLPAVGVEGGLSPCFILDLPQQILIINQT
jgi:hypothetical protein